MRLTCPNLSAENSITHGFFTRNGGVSSGLYSSLNCGYGSGDDISIVEKNREIVAKELGTTAGSLCTAYQIHSPNAVKLDKAWHWKEAPEADALVTTTPGIAIGILTADCLPVLFYDNKNGVIGAAHAGWKGALTGVIESTLEAMKGLGADPASTIATMGPAIAQNSYEVGNEFHGLFIKHAPENNSYFARGSRSGHYLFDLKTYALDRLRTAGVERINSLPDDTCQQEHNFFSFRRSTLRGEKTYGRQISAIMLK